jgi:hypothetical protein
VKTFACVLASVCLASGQVSAADEFQKVKCGTDIPRELIGQRSPNERIVVIERKYRALGLKHLGVDEISGRLSSINWLICGAEFIALVDRSGLVGDAMPVPPHSKQSPAFSGTCQLNGKDQPDIILAILDRTDDMDNLPARLAWKIDRKNMKFVKVPTEGLLCPKSGIYTVDGGL